MSDDELDDFDDLLDPKAIARRKAEKLARDIVELSALGDLLDEGALADQFARDEGFAAFVAGTIWRMERSA